MQKITEAKEKEIREILEESLTGTKYEHLLDCEIDEIIRLSNFIWKDDIELIKSICTYGLNLLESSAESLRKFLPELSEYFCENTDNGIE